MQNYKIVLDTLHNTLFTGKVFYRLPHADSTNDYLSGMLKDAKDPLQEGTAILTYNQTHGKGQYGSHWESAPGQNLAISILFYPKFLHLHQQFLLNMAMAVGVCRFSNTYLEDTIIKWPNDIFYKNKKTGGMLIENSISGKRWLSSVVGIGLNINQKEFPGLPHAASWQMISGKTYDLDKLIEPLCQYIEEAYLHLMRQHTDEITREYKSRLFRHREWHNYEDKSGRFTGMIEDVTPEGKLIIKKKSGEVREYGFKEVSFVLSG